MLENPLTPPERRRVVSLIADRDQVLADRLEAELAADVDPLVATLQAALKATTDATALRMNDMVEVFRETAKGMRDDARESREAQGAEFRSLRLQVVGVVALALILMAGLVGVGVVYRAGGVSISTSAQAAQPTAVDVAEDLGVAGPSPQLTEPQL